jgi:hypothetical protein
MARLHAEAAKRRRIARKNVGFTERDSFSGPTLEFPGVDIDAVHRAAERAKSRKLA